MKSQRGYCNDILMRIAQIERFTAEGEAAFMQDDRTQEAVIRCFEVIGEAVKRLDPTLTGQHPQINWPAYAGFRDVLIHQYDSTRLDKVWEAVQDDLAPLQETIQTLLAALLPDNTSESDNT